MIRINLLPLEDRKPTGHLRLPSFSGSMVLWPFVIAVVYVGMIFAISTLQAKSVKELEKKISQAKIESASLKPQLEKIKKLTREREEVNRRLGIIADLDRERYFRVQILNDISEKLPSNCWLTAVKEVGEAKLAIEGVTFSNYIIADLMNNLERSDRFKEVTLKYSQEGKVMDYSVIRFALESEVNPGM